MIFKWKNIWSVNDVWWYKQSRFQWRVMDFSSPAKSLRYAVILKPPELCSKSLLLPYASVKHLNSSEWKKIIYKLSKLYFILFNPLNHAFCWHLFYFLSYNIIRYPSSVPLTNSNSRGVGLRTHPAYSRAKL